MDRNWSGQHIKHVGNIITSTLDDKDDIELKIREYFCQVNKLLSDFQELWHDVLSELLINTATHFIEDKLGYLDQSMSKGYTDHGTEEWEAFWTWHIILIASCCHHC